MFGATAISFEGDDADRASLRELARRRKMTVAKLTRQAIWSVFGDELEELRPFFVDSDVSSEKQEDLAEKQRA